MGACPLRLVTESFFGPEAAVWRMVWLHSWWLGPAACWQRMHVLWPGLCGLVLLWCSSGYCFFGDTPCVFFLWRHWFLTWCHVSCSVQKVSVTALIRYLQGFHPQAAGHFTLVCCCCCFCSLVTMWLLSVVECTSTWFCGVVCLQVTLQACWSSVHKYSP